MGKETEQQAGDQAADVRDVVDMRDGEADHEVQADPEDQLADEAARPRLPAVARRAVDRKDECAEDAEDRAAGADGRLADQVRRARRGGADAADEVDDGEAARAEEGLVEAAELVEGPRVRGPMDPAAVKEHGGQETPVFAALQRAGKNRAELRQLVVVVLRVDGGL